jgi:hypothetical protein
LFSGISHFFYGSLLARPAAACSPKFVQSRSFFAESRTEIGLADIGALTKSGEGNLAIHQKTQFHLSKFGSDRVFPLLFQPIWV